MTVTATLALAAHVAPTLPLTSGGNHSHEKHTGAAFPAANLSGIILSFADLSNCTFAAGTNLSFADFTGANLTNANLAGCNIDNALFRGANLSNAVIPCAEAADFRGAVLTGVVASCAQCGIPNAKDQCTVGDPLTLCLGTAPFRGVVSGVVFNDANSNGALDFGETGVAGVQINASTSGGPGFAVTDSRGSFIIIASATGPASVTLDTATLPPGAVLDGTPLQAFDLTACRSGQGRNFPVLSPPTPARTTTFGRIKRLYR